MRRLHDICRSALHACMVLGVLSPGAAMAAAPRLEVQTRIDEGSGDVVHRSVAPGAVLRVGDAVRLRVTAWSDGYLYVVALTSSGAAVLLHPPAGPAEPVRAGDELAVSRDGGFLPLDSHPGREHVLAFVSDTPLDSLARLLTRLEAAATGADAESLLELMSSDGFEAAHLAFDRRPAAVAVAPVPAGIPAAGADAGTSSQAGSEDASAAALEAAGRDSGASGGWLAGLSAFFGGSREPTAKAVPAAGENSKPGANTRPEPTLSRRVDGSGRSVVVLDGAAPPPPRDSEVLSRSGSRIRALLDEPESPRTVAVPAPARDPPAPTGRTASSTTAKAAARPAPSPAPAAPAVADTQAMVTAAPRATAPDAPSPEAAARATAPSDAHVPATPSAPSDPALGGPASSAMAAGAAPAAQVALLTAAPGRPVEQSAARLTQVDLSGNAAVAAAVVMVVTPEGTTSGVLVNEHGQVLTNWHGVHAYDAVLVLFKQAGGTGPAVATPHLGRLVAHSKFADLALLQVDGLPAGVAPPALVSQVEVEGGTPLHAIGPGADGQWRHSVAMVDRIRRNSSWYSTRRVLHRADVLRAEMADPQAIAGVPLFNDEFELVGLGAMSRSDNGELIGISASTLRAFLAAAGG